MYEFNQEIIDALKEGKTVWKRDNAYADWISITKEEQIEVCLESVHTAQWSLTKPKKIIEKKTTAYITDFILEAIKMRNDIGTNFTFVKTNTVRNEIEIIHKEEVDDDN